MIDIFCRFYEKWRNEGSIVFENESAYSILSVTPATPGHAIVIAKKHVERLEELKGRDLEGFIDAIPETCQAVRNIYDSSPECIVEFYQALRENPPVPQSRALAEKMLNHKHLHVKPDSAHNIGINVGGYAGQEASHLHAQLFPRRERGLGVVAAMRLLFDKEDNFY
jgi:diadenosine tetraphosphate (Ap4A) HIT family hydrolase